MRKLFSFILLSSTLLLACERDTTYDSFAQCIADSGVQFYGAFWCPHCKDQKDIFGDSADLLPYVECDPNGKDSQAKLCEDENIGNYPTWEFPDGSKETGVYTLEELSEATNCPLPGEGSVMRD